MGPFNQFYKTYSGHKPKTTREFITMLDSDDAFRDFMMLCRDDILRFVRNVCGTRLPFEDEFGAYYDGMTMIPSNLIILLKYALELSELKQKLRLRPMVMMATPPESSVSSLSSLSSEASPLDRPMEQQEPEPEPEQEPEPESLQEPEPEHLKPEPVQVQVQTSPYLRPKRVSEWTIFNRPIDQKIRMEAIELGNFEDYKMPFPCCQAWLTCYRSGKYMPCINKREKKKCKHSECKDEESCKYCCSHVRVRSLCDRNTGCGRPKYCQTRENYHRCFQPKYNDFQCTKCSRRKK